MDPFTQLAIAVVLMVASAFLMPRAKQARAEVQELDNPTADASKEITAIFGTVTITEPNIIFYGEKSTRTREISA